MKSKIFFQLLFIVAGFFTFCATSVAGEIYDAKVIGISISSTEIGIKVQDQSVKVTQPSCATGSYQWAFSPSSGAANMFLSVALTAKTSGQKVRIVGASSCTISGNKENIEYLMLVDGPM